MKIKIIDFDSIEAVTSVIKGDVLAFPTETVFGFGVIYDSKMAFDKLCLLKGRRPDKPFTVMVSKKEDIVRFVDLNAKMERLINRFMPGEITILFPSKPGLMEHINLNQPTIGIRISSKKEVINLIDRVGKPMLVTSANYSSKPPISNIDDLIEQFDGKIKYVVNGECSSMLPSTIVKIDGDNLLLVRKGSIPYEDILEEWEK